MRPRDENDRVSEDSETNQTTASSLSTIQHSWLLPAAYKLLLLASQPLELPAVTPMELESSILFPQSSILIAEIHAKFLGLEEPKREQLIYEADHTWIPALVKLVHEYHRELFEPLFIDKPSLYWLPSRRGRMTSYLFYDWQTWVQLDALFRLETLYLLMEVVLFELDTPLAERMRNLAAEKLRVEPLGFDAERNCYWYFDDYCRIYVEEPLSFDKVIGNGLVSNHKYSHSSVDDDEAHRMQTRRSKRRREDIEEQSPRLPQEYTVQHSLRRNRSSSSTFSQDEQQWCIKKWKHYIPCFSQDTLVHSQWKVCVQGVDELREMLLHWKDKRNASDRQLKKRLSAELLPRWEAEEDRLVKEREKREKKDWIPTAKRRSSRVMEKRYVQQEEEKIREKEREETEKIQKRRQRLQAERLAVVQVIEREREKEFREFRQFNDANTQPPNGMQWREIGIRQLRDKKRIPYVRLSDDEQEPQEIESFQYVVFFNELSVLNEYNRWLEDNSTIWRLIDSFALYSPATGQMAAIEDLDKKELLVLEGILIPPSKESDEQSVTMPAAFRCDHIQDWCIEYGMEPKLWLKSSRGIWYQLKDPYKEYRNVYQTTRRKFELCSRIYILCMTLSPLVCSYSKIVEYLSFSYGEMKPYTEEEIWMEAPFILSQFLSMNQGRIVHSGFFRHLQKKFRQSVEHRRHPTPCWNNLSPSTTPWDAPWNSDCQHFHKNDR